jgi:hypothetical protein
MATALVGLSPRCPLITRRVRWMVLEIGPRSVSVQPPNAAATSLTLAQRKEHYATVQREVAAIIDALGEPIDPGIYATVVGLRAHGLPTTMSCEGHSDRSRPYPWVSLANTAVGPIAESLPPPWAESLANSLETRVPGIRRYYDRAVASVSDHRRARTILWTVNRPLDIRASISRLLRVPANNRGATITQSVKARFVQIKSLNQATLSDVNRLLDEFYATRQAPVQASRLVTLDQFSAVEIVPADARFDYPTPTHWTVSDAERLEADRAEFAAFASFLQTRLLAERSNR